MKGGVFMSLSIDFFSMPPKSQEVSQIQGAEHAKLENEQQQVAAQFENVVRQQSETAIRRRDVDNEELRNEERRQGKKKKKREMKTSTSPKDGVESEEEEKIASNPLSGGFFDVKI